jgi:putative addiction module component (TIGR02574 family)
MPTLDTQTAIASALALPAEERIAVLDAIHVSLVDSSVDHGPSEGDPDEVASGWAEEIARRLADIESGRVKTIPADEAEGMIRDPAPPRV